MLEKRKAHKQGCDLFTITNEILKTLNKKSLEKRKCSNCARPRFHLIKFICCKQFFCLTCFTFNRFEMRNFTCTFCQKSFINNSNEFIETLKNFTLVIWQAMYVVNEEKENGLSNTIREALRMQDDSEALNIDRVIQYANPNVNINWINTIRNDKFDYGLCEKWISLPGKYAQFFNIFANCTIQNLICRSLNVPDVFWIGFNFLSVSLILKHMKYDTVNSNLHTDIVTKLYENIDIILKGFMTMIVTWANIVVGLYFGNNWHKEGLLIMSCFTIPIVWVIHLEIRKKIHSHMKSEIKYQFL